MEKYSLQAYDDSQNQIAKIKARGPVIIKLSGKTVLDESIFRNVLRQVVFLSRTCRIPTVLVHGAGPQLSEALGEKRLDKNGERITPPEKICKVADTSKKISKYVYSESVRLMGDKSLVSFIGPLMVASERRGKKNASADFVGAPHVRALLRQTVYPVFPVAPEFKRRLWIAGHIGHCIKTGELTNINADAVAAGIAEVASASKLILLGNTKGILDKSGNTIGEVRGAADIERLVRSGVVDEGMRAKVNYAAKVASSGTDVHIMPQTSDKYPDLLLKELLSKDGVPDRATMLSTFDPVHFRD